MGEIQQGRYDRLLRRTAAQVGPGSKVGNALEDLFPVLEVENTPSELLRAVGWKLGAGQSVRTPAVGARAAIQLFNPAGSQHLIVLTKMLVGVRPFDRVNAGPSFDALVTASIAGQQRDTRDGVLSQTVGLIQREDNGLVANLLNFLLPDATTIEISDSNDIAVLAPGTGWRLTTGNLNTELNVSFFYRERVAEPEELDF